MTPLNARPNSLQTTIAERLRRARAGRVSAQPISLRPDPTSIPLSFSQERYWFLQLLDPNGQTHNRAFARRLDGDLDVQLMAQALSRIIARHEILRTVIETEEGGPVARVLLPETIVLPVIDLSDHNEDAQDAHARKTASELTRSVIDIASGPMVRCYLFRCSATKHILLLVMHHMVFDGWSEEIFMHELATFYRAGASGDADEATPLPLAEPMIQYADYAAWQRQRLSGERLEKLEAFWTEQLAGAPALLELPLDRPRPPVQTYRGKIQEIHLPAELVRDLQALSQRQNTTLFMTLLAAYYLLLFRYTGQVDIVIGASVSGRQHVATEPMLGYFTNTLALRASIAGTLTFIEVLARVRNMALDAYTHQEYPVEKLFAALPIERDSSYPPLFQVFFNLENIPKTDSPDMGLEVTPFALEDAESMYDLAVELHQCDGALRGSFQHNSDLFSAEKIARMVQHYGILLTNIVASPGAAIDQIPMLTAAEQSQILIDWNKSPVPYSKEGSVQELFERCVAQAPDATAIIMPIPGNGRTGVGFLYEGRDSRLTYRELNRWVNFLAADLRDKGVGPGQLVAICVDRSLEMAVAVLAVIKAGGTYLPLDTNYPEARLEFMLTDSGAALLLTDGTMSQTDASVRVPGQHIAPKFIPPYTTVVDIAAYPRQNAVLDCAWDENPPVAVSADDLLYIIYTSGTTGNPKGIMMHHGGVYNKALWHRRVFQRASSNVLLQLAPFGTDVWVADLLGAIIAGGSLVMARPEDQYDGRRITDLIARYGVTDTEMVPSMLQTTLTDGSLANCRSLKRLFSGSDELTRDLKDRALDLLDVELINAYGLTETSICATQWKCERDHPYPVVPIGRPEAHSTIYLLNPAMQPVPVGVPGEIYIGGPCLAHGYLNRPDLTAERFLPDPFSQAAEARLYRTGDLGRFLPDGNIEYLGRIDHQVQVHGARVELGEIEAILLNEGSVREAVVVYKSVAGEKNDASAKQLIAYIVTFGGEDISVPDLHRSLRSRLPLYMIPAHFVMLDALPLNAHGKVDRNSLPKPVMDRPSSEIVAPRTPIEEQLAAIWREVLNLTQIGIHDNFFTLGGHSLLATQVIARLSQRLQIEMPLRALFDEPTIAEFSRRILETMLQREVVESGPQRFTMVSKDT